MSNFSLPLLLRAPTPTQSSLTFSEANPRDLKRWISRLPKANLGEMARQLYQGLTELNQLITPSENRLQLLELLRPEVYFVCKHLERHFLNQAIVLDERPRKVANLCQALQNHLATGYKQIIQQVAPRYTRDQAGLFSTALQRAVHGLNGPLIRANQLYCPVQDGLWLELHQIYQIARQYQLHNTPVEEPLAHHSKVLSVEQTYVIALLMGCSRCNQMRQLNIGKLADALEAWSALVKLQSPATQSSLFALDPTADKPPLYRTLFSDEQSPRLLGINTLALAEAINQYLALPDDQRTPSPLLIPTGINTDLLQHLAVAWGDVAERTFQRTPGQGTLRLCIGMSALHFYVAGQKSFSELLQLNSATSAASFSLKMANDDADDPWASAFDTQRGKTSSVLLPYEEIEYPKNDGDSDSLSNNQHTFSTFDLNIVNHSPGGYCLAWQKDVPQQLQAGELVGIQDDAGQGWSVAIVRWIRQVRSGGTQMGIELIAPFAQPCGMQLIREQQNSQYLRTLMLPEVRAMEKPPTVLAPRLPFQEGSMVMINVNGEERRASLSNRQVSSASYNQFEYQMYDAPKAAETEKAMPDQEFDSLWGTL
ncbi:molecular chaperone [Pseudomonas syringae pv. syringae]|uniref:molecular chaperone n=1 Tax=Pseudomonas syringae TaxID=317 RepID=UPI000CDAD8C8|nr:molecular chaperone [Pseudomonas syringae]MCH5531032.1 molecular chaperone [Pseudomonas syringae pv. syringae]MCH5540837.1 molecular chaperone [Pseudomonas syringae pv. syringae]MCH5545968.1 molecular chaperone [Pseudomonas syringae pv. syringae]MCH5604133.1 molecular chaperone [Pseudomonas syringae pv. syringae]MCH5609476.1 molecular chaperone [Pseudomonas syringae pv. syringae]